MDPEWRRRVKLGYDQRDPKPDASEAVAPYRHPRKILGIGLNYKRHADALGAEYPTSPASFLKGDHTIIGPGESIVLPPMSHRVTSEAEIGLVIGRTCYEVEAADALGYVVGIVPVLDQTAEDILRENPRFLTRAKNFPTFFVFGPEILTLDDLAQADLSEVRVATYRNGALAHENVVANMLFAPAELVAFHSKVMPLYPGDIISSGTPGAVEIVPGDIVECRIDGVGVLRAGVTST